MKDEEIHQRVVSVAKQAKQQIELMELMMGGETIWNLAIANQIRAFQKLHPTWVNIVDDLKELEKINKEKYFGEDKVPYFGASLTDEGIGFLSTLTGMDAVDDYPTGLKLFTELWLNNLSASLWCEKYAHPLHRVCVVVLNYENLPPPFQVAADGMGHEGKTGDRVQATPQKCFSCDRNINKRGTCDPL